MGRMTNTRAKGASIADGSETAAVPLASARSPGRPEPSSPAPTESMPEPQRRLHGLDVAGRLTMLRDAFEKRSRPDADSKHQPWWVDHIAGLKRFLAAQRSRLVKVLIGVLAVAVVGWLPVRALLETTSTEAVINARLVTLRAPIEGEIAPGSSTLAVGTRARAGRGRCSASSTGAPTAAGSTTCSGSCTGWRANARR